MMLIYNLHFVHFPINLKKCEQKVITKFRSAINFAKVCLCLIHTNMKVHKIARLLKTACGTTG